eukprot:m.420193 g.420193  ORF g.420193 m.420193 type:complete len:516 (-) comp21314_c0_seq2:1313-2860(-)
MGKCIQLLGNLLLCVGLVVVPQCNGLNILWVPLPGSVSHLMLAMKTGRELSSRGHNVTVVTADINGTLYKKVDKEGVNFLVCEHPWSRAQFDSWIENVATLDPFNGATALTNMDADGCDAILMNKDILNKLSGIEAIVVDAASRCGSVVRDVLGIKQRVDFMPVTFMDPFFLPRLGGAIGPHALPQTGSRLTPDMDFGARVHNCIVQWVGYALEYFITDPITNALRQKHGLTGSHKEAMADTGMFIMQSSWAIEFPRAVPPSVRLVGPILPGPAKPLTGEIADFVQPGDRVLLVSFGSQARITDAVMQKLVDAFALLKCKVLWKITGNAPKTVSDNVKMVSWFNQNDLLGHEAVMAFLSHGGLNGVSEAAYHGVPVVGFPLFGDQWDNIARLQYRGMAEMIDSETFLATDLAAVVEQVMNDATYTESAQKISAIIKDTPKHPVALAADAIEYGFRHDSALFQQVPGLGDSYFVRNSWDVYGFFGAVVFLQYLLLKHTCEFCCGKSSARTQKNKTE